MSDPMYTVRFGGRVEIHGGASVVIVPVELEDGFETHLRAHVPTSVLLTDSERESRVSDACAEWICDHAA